MYIIHFSPGNVTGLPQVLPGGMGGIGGTGGMDGMARMGGMGGMGEMGGMGGKTFHPCWYIENPALKLACKKLYWIISVIG